MPDVGSKFDRTATEDQLMKAVRRAGIALRKAARKANLLDCSPDVKAMVPQLEQESKNVLARLTRIESIVGRKLGPTTDTNQEDAWEH